jgi:hypothetical protein
MCVLGLKSLDFIIEIKNFGHRKIKNAIFDQLTNLSKLASKREWKDAFLKFKQSRLLAKKLSLLSLL